MHRHGIEVEEDMNVLNSQFGDGNDSNAIILLGGRKRKKSGSSSQGREGDVSKKLSKNQQRKLRRLREEKSKKIFRDGALETLRKHQVDDSTLELLKSTATLGQTSTAKQKLKHALQLTRVGLLPPVDVPLLTRRTVGDSDDEDSMVNEVETTSRLLPKEDDFENPMPDQAPGHVDCQMACQVPSQVPSQDSGQVAVQLAGRALDREAGQVASDLLAKKESQVAGQVPVQEPSQAEAQDGFSSLKEAEKDKSMHLEMRQGKEKNAERNKSGYRAQAAESETRDRGKKFWVRVERRPEIDESRRNLPIAMMEHEIMEAIQDNLVVILCGETGCGKTTQVPQFLYEAGYGCKTRGPHPQWGTIGVTQPRRVAVLATARRVADELNVPVGKQVGFQVRYEKQVGPGSAIKLMTDGILLREVREDFLLRRYSVLIIDEAHERSLNTDILIGLLSRVVPLRQQMYEEWVRSGQQESTAVYPLRLVIMSATLRVEDFVQNQRMFPVPPPVLRVPARQFPVTIHFSKKTELQDYLAAARRKAAAIHRQLPAGGILIFVTGQREVEALCRRLRRDFPVRQPGQLGVADVEDEVAADEPRDDGASWQDTGYMGRDEADADKDENDLHEDSDQDADLSDDEDDLSGDIDADAVPTGTGGKLWDGMRPLAELANGVDVDAKSADRKSSLASEGGMYVLPLYAMLPAGKQMLVFGKVPEGARLVVVSTNVAETSVTIPGVKYVVDTGRAKERVYEPGSGVSRFQVSWISKASADQRAGRAGRTGPGHCYRLYSSALFNDSFPLFSAPEIQGAPLEGVLLQMKVMGIQKVVNFPFPSPPPLPSLVEAHSCLRHLSALHALTDLPTPIGSAMAAFPIAPRHSRMLLAVLSCAEPTRRPLLVAFATAAAAALSLQPPFLRAAGQPGDDDAAVGADSAGRTARKAARKAQSVFRSRFSDALSAVNALRAYELAKDKDGFCADHFLHAKTLREMALLNRQLVRIVAQNVGREDVFTAWTRSQEEFLDDVSRVWLDAKEASGKLTEKEEGILLQAICCGWADRVARKLSAAEMIEVREKDEKNGLKQTRKLAAYQPCSIADLAHIHPSSWLYSDAPSFVVFTEIVQSSRPYMMGISAIKSEWLPTVASCLCTFSKPLEEPPPWYDSKGDRVRAWVRPLFGPHSWELPLHAVDLPDGEIESRRVFARALLAGKVVGSITRLDGMLAANPTVILKAEALSHRRVAELLHRLDTSNVDSREKLVEKWRTDRLFLFPELRLWIQGVHRKKFDSMWGAIVEEALGGLKV